MYVAPPPPSKKHAGNGGLNPRRIIRKLRLALLQRSCRLPLCARQCKRRRKTLGFPVAITNCLVWGEFWGMALRHAGTPAPLPPRQHFSGQFMESVQWRWQAVPIVRCACDQTLWTCVLYLGCRPPGTATRGERLSTDGTLARSSNKPPASQKQCGYGNRDSGGRSPTTSVRLWLGIDRQPRQAR